MDLTPLLPQDALAPFAEEINGRQKRRERRSEQEAKTAEREAAAAAVVVAAATSRGLSAQELKVSRLVCCMSFCSILFRLAPLLVLVRSQLGTAATLGFRV